MEISRDESSNDAPKLLCCRACLDTDSKLFSIHECKLVDAFVCISGTPVLKDQLPQHLCEPCSGLLAKCMSFRAMCLRTQQCLLTELHKGELTTNYIRTIDKPLHPLLQDPSFTAEQTIDYTGTSTVYDIKQEPIIDFVDIDSIINPVNMKAEPVKKDEVKVNVTVENVFVVKDNKRRKRKTTGAKKKVKKEIDTEENNDPIYEDEEIAKDPVKRKDIERRKRKSESGVRSNINTEINTKDNNDGIYDYEYEIALSLTKRKDNKDKIKKKGIRIKKIVDEEIGNDSNDNDNDVIDVDVDEDIKPVPTKRKRKKKEEVTRKFRNPANDYMPVFDFGTFEGTYGVRVVALTKEEQLAEIEARKASPNYQSSPFRCEDCGKGFLAEAPYANHRARHSPSMGPHACEVCSVRFRMRCRRQEHQDMHRLKFLCQECGFVSRNRHQARRHHDVHAGKTFACQHCGKTFTKSSTYLSHVRLAHPAMNVACDMCGETFVGHVGLRQHKTKMHSENMKPQQHQCPTCAASFLSLDALNRHTDTTEPHAALSPCERCGHNCAGADALRAHERERHAADDHRCEECEQTFANAASYELHHRRKHLNQRASNAGRRGLVRRTPRTGRFVCELCGRILPNATLLRYHQRIHQDVKPFACPHCPKTFAAKHARDWHTRTHTGERPFQCPQCPLAFSLKGNLQRHHKAVHLGLRKSIPCGICRRAFTSGSILRMHVNTQHRGLPWPKRARRKRDKRDAGE